MGFVASFQRPEAFAVFTQRLSKRFPHRGRRMLSCTLFGEYLATKKVTEESPGGRRSAAAKELTKRFEKRQQFHHERDLCNRRHQDPAGEIRGFPGDRSTRRPACTRD